MADEVLDQTSQGQDGTDGADPTGAAKPLVPDTADGGQPAGEPEDALKVAEKELAQLQGRVQKNEAGASKKIGELTEANNNQGELVKQVQQENLTLRQQLTAYQNNPQRQPVYQQPANDEYDDGQSQTQQQGQPANVFVDQPARDMLIQEIAPQMKTVTDYVEEQQRVTKAATQKADYMSNLGLSSEQADSVAEAMEKGDKTTAIAIANQAQVVNTMRDAEKLKNRQDAMPPVLGASGAVPGGSGDNGADVSDAYNQLKSGDLTFSEKAKLMTNTPGLMQRLLNESQ